MVMEHLSKTTQTVIDAAWGAWNDDLPCNYEFISKPVVAALRAAVDEVLPVEHEIIGGLWEEKLNPVRNQLLEIINELNKLNE